LGTLIEHIGNQMQHYLGEGKESEEKKKTNLCECHSKPTCKAEYFREPHRLHYNMNKKLKGI
jgi:hypothetical protein